MCQSIRGWAYESIQIQVGLLRRSQVQILVWARRKIISKISRIVVTFVWHRNDRMRLHMVSDATHEWFNPIFTLFDMHSVRNVDHRRWSENMSPHKEGPHYTGKMFLGLMSASASFWCIRGFNFCSKIWRSKGAGEGV